MTLIALALCAALALAGSALAASEQGVPLPAQGASPAGTNDFSCKPSPLHPYPVVLVHGTFGNMQVSWGSIVPPLKRLGYCVFALDYGNGAIPNINATGDIPTSARQLRTFVDQVLDRMGARRVSIVGHSQGGMMPRYLIKFLSSTHEVDDLVGLSPSNHGTTVAVAPLAGPGCLACTQQVAGSPFITKLNAGDETPGKTDYTVIETKNDEVVTPYESEFLARDGNDVTNILLQDRCPSDLTDHVAIIFDPVAIEWMLNALGRPGSADPAFRPDCSGAALATYPNSSSVGKFSLRVGGLDRRAAATRHRRIRFTLNARTSAFRHVRVVLRARRRSGPVVGRSRVISIVGGRRKVALRLRHPLAPGRYFVTAAGRQINNDLGGSVTNRVRLRRR